MAQITSGIRKILNNPVVYNTLQNLMGARSSRTSFVKNYIQPTPGMKILDIGCGTAELLDFLPEDIEYYGFDADEDYIAFAKEKYGHRGQFSCAYVDDLSLGNLPKFDVVLASGLVHHLEDEEARQLFTTASKALGKGGRFINIDPCYDDGQSQIARWLISRDRGQNVRNKTGYEHLLDGSFKKVDSNVVHRSWIPYTHYIAVSGN